MKQKLLVLALLFIAILSFCTLSSAVTDPIVCTMEVSPSSLSEPGDVTVTITISNSGDTDLTDTLTLFDPTSQVVEDFGDEGSVTLEAGEVVTWTGTWAVNQRTLENGQIVYFVKYTLIDEDGESKSQSQPIRGTIEQNDYTASISVVRTIVPETARENQTVNVIYDITNDGTVSITNLTLQENSDIYDEELVIATELNSGETAQVTLPAVMGTKDISSEATITYTIADGTEVQTYLVEEQVITYGEPDVTVTLTSDTTGVLMNETVSLTLELVNTGNVDYTDVRVTDETLGDVFTNQTLAAGETLVLEKEITLTQTTDFQFTVVAIDSTGTEETFYSDTLSLLAVDPENALNLEMTLSADKTEVYSDSEAVLFIVTITNTSDDIATDVVVYQAETEIYTYSSINPGETKTLSRDVTLNMAGQYQFTAEATDSLGNVLEFESNILQMAFLDPTPAPVTADPSITATPEPTFVKATYPQISDPDIGTLPKLLRTFFYPLMIAGFILLAIAAVILLLATKKRFDLKKSSEKALDHLDRSRRRDYILPAEEQEPEHEEAEEEFDDDYQETTSSQEEPLSEEELPHMKYVRNAYQIAGRDQSSEDNYDDYRMEQSAEEDEEASQWESDGYDSDHTAYKRRAGRRSPYARQEEDAADQEDDYEEYDDYESYDEDTYDSDDHNPDETH